MAEHRHKRFVGCRPCGVMTPIQLPDPGDSEETIETYLDDWYGFFAAHGLHGLVELHCAVGAPLCGGPIWDPMAPFLFEVSGGSETFLVRATRTSIAEPRRYAFSPGSLQAEPAGVELDATDVRRALGMELAPESVPETQIEDLLRAVYASLDGLDADAVEIAFEDVDDPEVGVAALPDPALQRILDAAAGIFAPGARDRVERFLLENRGEDGLLALRVRRRAVALIA